MKSRWLIWPIALFILGLFIGAIFYYRANAGFTAWMDGPAFNQWRETSLHHQPVYMCALEGRIVDGKEQWRARLAPKPQGVRWSWKWFYGIDQTFYQQLVDSNVTQQGYRQIWTQFYPNANGEKRFQVIFLRIHDQDQASKN